MDRFSLSPLPRQNSQGTLRFSQIPYSPDNCPYTREKPKYSIYATLLSELTLRHLHPLGSGLATIPHPSHGYRGTTAPRSRRPVRHSFRGPSPFSIGQAGPKTAHIHALPHLRLHLHFAPRIRLSRLGPRCLSVYRKARAYARLVSFVSANRRARTLRVCLCTPKKRPHAWPAPGSFSETGRRTAPTEGGHSARTVPLPRQWGGRVQKGTRQINRYCGPLRSRLCGASRLASAPCHYQPWGGTRVHLLPSGVHFCRCAAVQCTIC